MVSLKGTLLLGSVISVSFRVFGVSAWAPSSLLFRFGFQGFGGFWGALGLCGLRGLGFRGLGFRGGLGFKGFRV